MDGKDDKGKGEERGTSGVSWVARGEYVELLLLRAKPAIGRCLRSRGEAELEREK